MLTVSLTPSGVADEHDSESGVEPAPWFGLASTSSGAGWNSLALTVPEPGTEIVLGVEALDVTAADAALHMGGIVYAEDGALLGGFQYAEFALPDGRSGSTESAFGGFALTVDVENRTASVAFTPPDEFGPVRLQAMLWVAGDGVATRAWHAGSAINWTLDNATSGTEAFVLDGSDFDVTHRPDLGAADGLAGVQGSRGVRAQATLDVTTTLHGFFTVEDQDHACVSTADASACQQLEGGAREGQAFVRGPEGTYYHKAHDALKGPAGAYTLTAQAYETLPRTCVDADDADACAGRDHTWDALVTGGADAPLATFE